MFSQVYKGHCYDKQCLQFGWEGGRPSEMMGKSFMYHVTKGWEKVGSQSDVMQKRFKEVFVSKHGAVRILKIKKVDAVSKQIGMSVRNCDSPGSWFCPGEYPPALAKLREIGFHGFGWTLSGEKAEHSKKFKVTSTTTVAPTTKQVAAEYAAAEAARGADESSSDAETGPDRAPKLVAEMQLYKDRYSERVQGNLGLGPRESDETLPRGSYRHSCDGCQMEMMDEGTVGRRGPKKIDVQCGVGFRRASWSRWRSRRGSEEDDPGPAIPFRWGHLIGGDFGLWERVRGRDFFGEVLPLQHQRRPLQHHRRHVSTCVLTIAEVVFPRAHHITHNAHLRKLATEHSPPATLPALLPEDILQMLALLERPVRPPLLLFRQVCEPTCFQYDHESEHLEVQALGSRLRLGQDLARSFASPLRPAPRPPPPH